MNIMKIFFSLFLILVMIGSISIRAQDDYVSFEFPPGATDKVEVFVQQDNYYHNVSINVNLTVGKVYLGYISYNGQDSPLGESLDPGNYSFNLNVSYLYLQSETGGTTYGIYKFVDNGAILESQVEIDSSYSTYLILVTLGIIFSAIGVFAVFIIYLKRKANR